MAKSKAKTWDAEIEVDWGGLSIGDMTARLGLKVERERLELDEANELFCGKRCAVLIANKAAAENGQKQLKGMEKSDVVEIEALVDIKSFNSTPKHFGTGLTFNLETVKPEMLAKFPKRRGVLCIQHKEDLPEGHDEE